MNPDTNPITATRPEAADALAMAAASEPDRQALYRGTAMIVAAMLILPCIDAIAKHVSEQISPGQLSWGRFAFQSIFLFAFVALGDGFRLGRNLWKHAGRGILIATGTVFFFIAVSHMPLADTMAIFFVEPLILTLLAPVFLGERIGWRRISAVIVGLAGSMLVIQPSFEAFGYIALLPIGAATAMAFYIILTRSLTRDTGTFAIQFFAGVFGALFMTGVLTAGTVLDIAPLAFTWPSPQEWLWMIALAAIATLGHLLIVQAVRHIGASMIAPYQYLEIVTATSLGYLIFGDFPGTATWFGIAIIVLAGLYVFHRERMRLSTE